MALARTLEVTINGCTSNRLTMQCEHDKAHDKLSFATMRQLSSILNEALQQAGVDNEELREDVCAKFIFQSSYFFDNRWVQYDEHRYRVGFCFQEFATEPFEPTKAIITDYVKGSMLHEAAIGIAEAPFRKKSTAPSFQKMGDVYDEEFRGSNGRNNQRNS